MQHLEEGHANSAVGQWVYWPPLTPQDILSPPKSCLIPGLLLSQLQTTAKQQTPQSEAFWGFCTPFQPPQESGICFWNICTRFGIWSPLRAPSTFPEKHTQSRTKKISQFLKGDYSTSLVLGKPKAWFDAIAPPTRKWLNLRWFQSSAGEGFPLHWKCSFKWGKNHQRTSTWMD